MALTASEASDKIRFKVLRFLGCKVALLNRPVVGSLVNGILSRDARQPMFGDPCLCGRKVGENTGRELSSNTGENPNLTKRYLCRHIQRVSHQPRDCGTNQVWLVSNTLCV